MPTGLHARTCGLRPAQAHIPDLALSWEFGRSCLTHNLKSCGSLWSAMVHLFPKTSWLYHNYCLTLLPPTSVLCCALKFPYVHLLIWTSFSVLKLGALEIMSYTPSPVPGQQGSYIPNPWLVIVRETWPPKVCLFLPELSNKVKWEKSGVVCWDISHKVTCTHSYLGGGGQINRPGSGLIARQPLFKRMNVWVDSWPTV